MKKLLLITCFTVLLVAAKAQTNFTHQDIPTYTAPAFVGEPRQEQRAERLPLVPLYTNDVIIDNNSAVDQRRVRLAVAFNGWLYVAFTTFDAASSTGGLTIKSSRDNGITWSVIYQAQTFDIQYPAIDIVVAGTDTNNLTLFLAGVNLTLSTSTYVLFVDRYNATTGSFLNNNYLQVNNTRPFYDVALATDYLSPAVGASPYSVGMLYSSFSSSYDSIVFVSSGDGGNTWSNRQTVATTGFYNRNISLAYGRSASGSNGRYFAAWERLSSSTNRTGNIYTSRCSSTFDDSWITPVNLDSLSSAMIGLCRNPSIATSFGTLDTDSGGVAAVVMVDRDYLGDGSDYDMLGFQNKRAHYSDFWYRFDIVNSNENDMHSDVSYDPTNNNFLATYYDSTNGKLPYIVNGFNLLTPSTWSTVSTQYNDLTTNLKAPYPRVEINPAVTQAAHVWIAEGANNKGIAMFDAEYNITGIAENNAITGNTIFPNPANTNANINFNLEKAGVVQITVYNVLGESMQTQTINATSGKNQATLNVENLPAGIYLVQIQIGNQIATKSLVIAH